MSIDANGFDRAFYLSQNLDVAAAGVDPYLHFTQYGWSEGRDPNQIFDSSFYLAANPDVAAARTDPLAHYLAYGWREGRDPSAMFDTSSYLAVNRDVAAAGVNPLVHYLAFGQAEGRALAPTSPTAVGFDAAYYLGANPDVQRAGIDPLAHYQQYGNSEGRQPNALFSKAFYLASNPDVAAAGVDAFDHYLSYGWREGRDPSANFSLTEYQASMGGSLGENPLLRYLQHDRYIGLPNEFTGPNPPQVLQARGNPLSVILADQATFAIDGALTRVTALSSPLNGHDLSGFTSFALSQSVADISITGTGRLPSYIVLGSGDDRLIGVFDLSAQILNFFGGAGALTVDAQIDNGFAALNSGSGGSLVSVRGSATVAFNGGAGPDGVTLGASDDTLSGGAGINILDGGAGEDLASWVTPVKADLLTGRAVSLGGPAIFDDTLIAIESLGGSAFNDILLGDDQANTIVGVNVSPSPSGNDILAGRGGDDTLWGFDGADILIGGRGADSIIGGEGNDLMIDAADAWGLGNRNPQAIGNEGDDRLVYLFGGEGEIARGSFFAGGTGADDYILDAVNGNWGSLGLEFSQIDHDRLDLSALRTTTGQKLDFQYVLSSASTPFYGGTVLDLSFFHDAQGDSLSGRVVLNGVFAPTDLRTDDFVFDHGFDWRGAIPADLLQLI
jgi:Ca2+-binding RTX toxin-like protein